MKKLLMINCMLFLSSCASILPCSSDLPYYKVIKIKPKGCVYQIYAKKNGEVFQIITFKDSTSTQGVRIKKGKYYAFKLKSEYELTPVINGVKLYPINSYEIHRDFNGTLIKIDNGSADLYYPENVKGLMYLGD